jgi:purine-binding chemotaxis protein CheW
MSQATLPGTDTARHTITGLDRYLTFQLAGEPYALPILDITEIIEQRNLTVVPMMPTFVRGVLNLRGRVVPVLDLAARFGRGSTNVARRTSIVLDVGRVLSLDELSLIQQTAHDSAPHQPTRQSTISWTRGPS